MLLLAFYILRIFIINFCEKTKCIYNVRDTKEILSRTYWAFSTCRIYHRSCFDFHVLSLEGHSFSDILYVASINITINPQSVDAKIEILKGNFAFFRIVCFFCCFRSEVGKSPNCSYHPTSKFNKQLQLYLFLRIYFYTILHVTLCYSK